VIPEPDRRIYAAAGYGRRQELGARAGLLVIDVVESFTGSRPLPIAEAINEYKTSCGEAAWAALPQIRALLEGFRRHGLTIVYTTGDPTAKVFSGNSTKGSLYNKADETIHLHSTRIPDIVAPLESEYVLKKSKASVFYATPLSAYFRKTGVDSLFIAGSTTSGCVRASVVDAYSSGFKVFVVEECCFDRSLFSHLVNLFEMNQKYADVITLDTALEMVKQHPARK
jgi:nicotinamidase-related amidase